MFNLLTISLIFIPVFFKFVYDIYTRGTVNNRIKEFVKPFIQYVLNEYNYKTWRISEIRNVAIKKEYKYTLVSVDLFITDININRINSPDVYVRMEGMINEDNTYEITKFKRINSMDVHQLIPENTQYLNILSLGFFGKLRELITGVGIPGLLKNIFNKGMDVQHCTFSSGVSFKCKNPIIKMYEDKNENNINQLTVDEEKLKKYENHDNSVRNKQHESFKDVEDEILMPDKSEFPIARSLRPIKFREKYEGIKNENILN